MSIANSQEGRATAGFNRLKGSFPLAANYCIAMTARSQSASHLLYQQVDSDGRVPSMHASYHGLK